MKIRTKFSIASGIVVFIVISVIATTTYLLVQQTLRKSTTAYVQDNASLLSNSISNWLISRSAQINILKNQLESDFSKQNFQSSLENKALTTDFSLVFGTLNDEKTLRSNDKNRVNPPGIDFRQRPWFKLAKNSNNTLFTAPYVDAATNELLLSVVSAINTENGFQGVIGGDLSLDAIANSVNTINFNGNGLAFLVDGEGKIITHPSSDLNNKQTQTVYSSSPANTKNILHIDHDGKEKLLYFYPLNNEAGVDWSIAMLLEKDKVYESLTAFTTRTLLIAIFSITCCVFILRKLAKLLLKPLDELEQAINVIASGGGDLTQRLTISSEDECGVVANSFNQFLSSLQSLVTGVIGKANNVEEQSSAAKSLSTESSRSLNKQYQLIDSLATAMHQMSTTSTEIASSAQEAASSVTSVNKSTTSSKALFEKTASDIASLSDSISNSQELSNQLAEHSNSIEQILSVINNVAEQTNLLALNAAIEAARAGEQGRGFAVVADEVRTLASRTQSSTTEIKSMIEQIQLFSSKVQQAMEQSKQKASQCVEQTEVANQSLNMISMSVKDIMDRNFQIAAAIEEQSTVIEEINKNTIYIKDISVQVDEFAKEQYETNTNLAENVNGQQSLLNKFIV
ncbi:MULTISPECIES: methyl-accepting chemotaxis protein [unclassified Pseudoalteromonas]|uniref:methyl-accepting chemotaxis protein n=1 Tax=unclassified Pseudoalteromonas TaxID=194690 RepID=UPI000C0694AA|nr:MULTISPECIES: methyl-accepting chemotaxis protein [unclassified Pseudoalteromonas]MDP2636035.1 methyl-accepting chemotaxis protein [Pseudoalteromonas sp. 1_MG-2023]PHN90645.1 chemotaxis protein [Pseudoalteromonas sp. 3D05]